MDQCRIATFAAVMCLISMVVEGSGITWISEPENITVAANSNVFIGCSYILAMDSNNAPYWFINGHLRSSGDLAGLFNGSGLLIQNVDESLNSNSYQCGISQYTSGVGYLTVLNAAEYDKLFSESPLPTQSCANAGRSLNTSGTTPVLIDIYDRHHTTSASATQAYDQLHDGKNNSKTTTDMTTTAFTPWIALGAAGGVVLTLTVIIAVVTIFIIIKRQRKLKEGNQTGPCVYEECQSTVPTSKSEEHIYAEIAAPPNPSNKITTEPNQCYQGVTAARASVQLVRCPAYESRGAIHM